MQASDIWNVSALLQESRSHLENRYPSILVEGEISNCMVSRAGHAYFSLKDATGQIRCAFFGVTRLGAFSFQNGDAVLVQGKVTIYPARGDLQIQVQRIEAQGVGALQLQFEVLKQKLAAEGLFDSARKRPIPSFPEKIAIVSGEKSAALQDMLRMLTACPWIQCDVYPSLVQGEKAPESLHAALEKAYLGDYDCLIIGRGGGSLEDLQAFNDEALVRHLAKAPFPIISAVGHEVDWSLSDLVADFRAATPTHAAKMLCQSWLQGIESLSHYRSLFTTLLNQWQERIGYRFALIEQRFQHWTDAFTDQLQWLDTMERQLINGIETAYTQQAHHFLQLCQRFELQNPVKRLSEGFAFCERENGNKITSAKEACTEQHFYLRFFDKKVPVSAEQTQASLSGS